MGALDHIYLKKPNSKNIANLGKEKSTFARSASCSHVTLLDCTQAACRIRVRCGGLEIEQNAIVT